MKSFLTFSVMLVAASAAYGNSITFNSVNTVGGQPVSADATFVTTAGELVITLQDTLANPTDIGQLVSDLQFSMNTGDTSATLSSSSADFITVNSGGSVTDNGTSSTGWGFGSGTLGSGNYLLCVICGDGISLPPHVAPAELIIGPGPYTNANASIAGNGPHNPFMNQTATFTILDSNITNSTTISNVLFSYGTTFGLDGAGIPTPEPRSYVFLALVSGLIVLASRRKKIA